MRTRTSIKGHPPHPMLIVFPIALYIAGLAALVTFVLDRDVFWYRAGYVAMISGACVGIVAAVFGLIDLLGLPRDSRAKVTGALHGVAAVTATVLFGIAGLLLHANANLPEAPGSYELPLALAIVGLAVLLGAGLLGWHLVDVHHVGVSELPGHAGGIPLREPLTRGEPAHAPHAETRP